MDSANKNSVNIKTSPTEVNNQAVKSSRINTSNKFDISILGKIDLLEAEKIASEEVLFLTEADLIDGLEDFELVPVKNYRQDLELSVPKEKKISQELVLETTDVEIESGLQSIPSFGDENVGLESTENINSKVSTKTDLVEEKVEIVQKVEIKKTEENETIIDHNFAESYKPDLEISYSESLIDPMEKSPDVDIIENDIIIQNQVDEVIYLDSSDLISEIIDDMPDAKKLFSIKINEETLDAQLASILNEEVFDKIDDKALQKYIHIDSKCRFADDQFLNKQIADDSVSYNEDPLTERLVKMIEVADGKMELLEITAKEGEYFNYILEDYTLYNSEKFDNVFKEEVFYIDSDFEFIENAIIRDDFTKYIHEIDDYFESEDSLIQSEISEILGLIPDEKEYIEDKLFGDYYKKFDLDNEIDFIKPEIDFFRSNYTGTKNLNYFTKNEGGFSESERRSIEEDISSANAIVFEEDISEIEEILRKDFNFKPEAIIEKTVMIEEPAEIVEIEEITDITDKIIILDDKERLFELVSEFPEKHENLIKLLSYLDGLFEKLPEEVIRKFAESEYFELYSKVLKEIGV